MELTREGTTERLVLIFGVCSLLSCEEPKKKNDVLPCAALRKPTEGLCLVRPGDIHLDATPKCALRDCGWPSLGVTHHLAGVRT